MSVAVEITREAFAKDFAISRDHVPAVGDPRWKDWCEPLREFLKTPRTGKQLGEWEKTNKLRSNFLPHMLAWLDRKGQLIHENKKWRSR